MGCAWCSKSRDSETTEYVPLSQIDVGEPWCLRPNELETWFRNNICNGLMEFDKDCRKAINSVVQHIYNNFTVDKIIKGGSLGKDTMLEGHSDVDLVVFVNPPYLEPINEYRSPMDYQNQLKTVIEDLEDSLCELPSVTINRTDDYLVNFDIQVGTRRVSVDLLPTANNDHPDVYSEMMNQTSSQSEREFYSASFVEKQRDFVRNQPDNVRDLIRMVKYWAYTCLPKRLQKSYPLELITIYCWEKAGGPESFRKVQGLKVVLEFLGSQRWKRRQFWVNHYSKTRAKFAMKTLRMESLARMKLYMCLVLLMLVGCTWSFAEKDDFLPEELVKELKSRGKVKQAESISGGSCVHNAHCSMADGERCIGSDTRRGIPGVCIDVLRAHRRSSRFFDSAAQWIRQYFKQSHPTTE